MRKMEVYKEDINCIGNTKSNDGGFVTIILDGKTCNLEHILLREILKCFGEEYKILEENDFAWDEDDDITEWDIEVKTNLPWDMLPETHKRKY